MKGMKLMKQLQSFTDGYINLPVRQTEEGNIEFDVEQVAVGIGLTHLATSGNLVVRWDRVRKYLSCPEVGTGDFITEPQFYELAIKANSKKAKKFQYWVTHDVLPSIRKTGTYSTDNTLTAQRNKRLEIMEANKRIRQATAISEIAKEILNIDDKQRMLKQAAALLIEKSPSNVTKESDARYSTEWISKEIGIDSKIVDRYGRLYGVKAKPGETNKFGEWQINPQTFDYVWRYNQKGVLEVAEFIKTEN